jgi:hypothetical protein
MLEGVVSFLAAVGDDDVAAQVFPERVAELIVIFGEQRFDG